MVDSAYFVAKLAPSPEGRRRILSLDGAGIYGLTAAIWLKQLVMADPAFLAPGNVNMLAGISAGALNSLLLAKYDNPRDAVLSGELERFWQEPIGAFSNTHPIPAWLSLWNITAWFGKQDFLDQLEKHFGDMKLRDLKQTVLIATFDWSGTPSALPIDFASPNPFSPEAMMGLPLPPSPTQKTEWRPRVYSNVKEHPDLDCRVVDIAYGAATPPGWRAVRGGIGDAGAYTANPSAMAIAEVVAVRRDEDKTKTPGEMLDSIACLSLGDGSVVPHYWLSNFNFSSSQFGVYPTNPFQGQWLPPSATISLDATTEAQDYISNHLLGNRRYFRLDPGIMPFPTLLATMLSRFPWYKQFFIDQAYTATAGNTSLNKVAQATAFLMSPGWMGAPMPPGPPAPPANPPVNPIL